MGEPALVNFGSAVQASSATGSASMPGSRVNGNLLLAYIHTARTGGVTFSIGSGWTIPAGLHNNSANSSAAIAWRYVDGTEADPSFTLSSSVFWDCQVFQYSGVQAVTPIGNTNNATGIASSTITGASITSTQDNSTLVYMLFNNGVSITTPLPQQYTERSILNTGFESNLICDGVLGISGSVGLALSYPLQSVADWNSFGMELLGTGVGSDYQHSSQVIQEAIETYSTPIMSAYASQVIQEVPETYSTPIMNAFASQICVQVLRSQSITARLFEAASAVDIINSILHPGLPPPEPARFIRDWWDCDEFGRFQPGAGIRRIR
jgi:hypothetical protein